MSEVDLRILFPFFLSMIVVVVVPFCPFPIFELTFLVVWIAGLSNSPAWSSVTVASANVVFPNIMMTLFLWTSILLQVLKYNQGLHRGVIETAQTWIFCEPKKTADVEEDPARDDETFEEQDAVEADTSPLFLEDWGLGINIGAAGKYVIENTNEGPNRGEQHHTDDGFVRTCIRIHCGTTQHVNADVDFDVVNIERRAHDACTVQLKHADFMPISAKEVGWITGASITNISWWLFLLALTSWTYIVVPDMMQVNVAGYGYLFAQSIIIGCSIDQMNRNTASFQTRVYFMPCGYCCRRTMFIG